MQYLSDVRNESRLSTVIDFSMSFQLRLVSVLQYISFVLQGLCFLSAEVLRSFGYQCRNSDDFNHMWESCKISIGKRCQNLRTKGKDGARVD